MNEFWFEIVRRSRNRYEWVFVAVRDGRPRVLARAGRDYRSRKKVRRAIERLRCAFPQAEIRRREPYPLPYTRFEVVPGVLPLMVEASPEGYVPAAARERQFAAITPAKAQEQPRVAAPQEKEKEAQEPKPVPAGGKKKAT